MGGQTTHGTSQNLQTTISKVSSTPGLMLRVSKMVDGVWSKQSSSEASGISLGSVFNV